MANIDIRTWLEKFKLGQYGDLFLENEVGFNDLKEIANHDDLKELGISSFMDRKKIISGLMTQSETIQEDEEYSSDNDGISDDESEFEFDEEKNRQEIEDFKNLVSESIEKFGERSSAVAAALEGLGLRYYLDEQYTASIENYLEAIAIYDELKGDIHDESLAANRFSRYKFHYEISECHKFIGLCYNDMENYTEALAHLKKAYELVVLMEGEESEEAEEIESFLRGVLDEMEELSDEENEVSDEEFEAQAEEIVDKMLLHIENGDTSYNNKDFDKAMSFYQEALDLQLSVLEEESEEVATSLVNIANCHYWKSNYDKAIELYLKALAIRLKLFGEVNKDVESTYWDLGHTYYVNEDYKESIRYFKKVVDIRYKLEGDNQEDIARAKMDLGNSYYWDENYNPAIRRFQDALEILEEVYGEEHKDYADCSNRLGLCYYWAEQYEPAILSFLKAFGIRKRLFGDDSEEADTSRFDLAKAFYYQDMDENALELFKESRSFRKHFFGSDSEEYKETLEWIDKY